MKAFDFSLPARAFFGSVESRRLQVTAPTIGKRAMTGCAIMSKGGEDHFVLLKIGGLSRFKFNQGGRG
jgi:hypothetical protein